MYPFYTEGTNELLKAGSLIAMYSIHRASERLKGACACASRKRREDNDLSNKVSSWILKSSEIGDERPLSGCSFSNDGNLLATCSLSGITKIWSVAGDEHEVKLVSKLRGQQNHMDRATDVAFSPGLGSTVVATASTDATAGLWNTEGGSPCLLTTFKGHEKRLARIAFHPSGNYLGTASFDHTWRLWDVDSGQELLVQEGHCREVYDICFHPDGSLAASCGMDKVARVVKLVV